MSYQLLVVKKTQTSNRLGIPLTLSSKNVSFLDGHNRDPPRSIFTSELGQGLERNYAKIILKLYIDDRLIIPTPDLFLLVFKNLI